jgi:hypothetical protein
MASMTHLCLRIRGIINSASRLSFIVASFFMFEQEATDPGADE